MAVSFASGTRTGNGVSDTLVVTGFQPNVVCVRKSSGGSNFDWRISTMAANTSKDVTADNGPRTDRIRNFAATGFNVGDEDAVNTNGATYKWVAFTTDGIVNDVFTYTGDGTDDRVVGSFGFQATGAMVFSMAVANSWCATSNMVSGEACALNAAGSPITDAIQVLGNGSITVGTLANVNLRVYHVIVWATANLFVSPFTYTGDGTDGRNVAHGLGADPYLSLIMRLQTTDPVWRMRADTGDSSFNGVSTGTDTNCIQATNSVFLNLGSDASVNLNTETYYGLVLGNGVAGGGGGPPGGGGRPGRPRPPGGGPPPGGGGSLTGPVLKKLRFPEKVI